MGSVTGQMLARRRSCRLGELRNQLVNQLCEVIRRLSKTRAALRLRWRLQSSVTRTEVI